MRRAILTGLLALVVSNATGCASYWIDRGRDAADVFSMTVGFGFGAKARGGPIVAGLGSYGDQYGLLGGAWGKIEVGEGSLLRPGENKDVCLLLNVHELAPPGNASLRNKEYRSIGAFVLTVPEGDGIYPQIYHLTHVEAYAAVGIGVRVSFNASELLDLVLGFFCIDILDDDLELSPD